MVRLRAFTVAYAVHWGSWAWQLPAALLLRAAGNLYDFWSEE